MHLSDTLPIDELLARSLAPGRKAQLRLMVASDASGPLVLTALVVTGRCQGSVLLAVAGVHGDEYEGMEAIRQCFAALNPQRMAGTFLGIPVANPLAYAARSRATPAAIDGLNLARVFPGVSDGTLTLRLAYHLLALVERNVGEDDLFIDLHSGSADVAFAPLIGFRDLPGAGATASEEAARHFGLPRLWRIPDSAGPFNAETARRGIPTLGTETTGRAGCDPADVTDYVAGLNHLLAYLRIVAPPDAMSRYSGPGRPTVDISAPVGGFFRSCMQIDDEVEEGARLGEIVDIAGEAVAGIAAPAAGTIWARRTTPLVHPGELLGVIACR